ncbi:uncharacterized protein LOC129326993 [Eublepharis macularius]|uniref:Uncharacterized protein LOC129326993 n=1 Tax=Eublepharis macularius TaxID=481883 RepID=A0AA97J5B5_EUBMA|nr:uncharacterized protein LOC129326993 [Eublepharis macularius]XP_054831330.1 uncharacterized protein LOC129326993 [Eublepharis macularius]XP_054831331.1 uncharacterized protein LOC129326993 [Eublepharis macularius]
MDTPEEATSKPLIIAQMNKEAQCELVPVLAPQGFSKEDEDFFSGLSPEEAECLEYLLQTINTLEGEILQDDEGEERIAESLDAGDPPNSNVGANIQQSTSREASTTKPVSKMNMIKSFSEESIDIGLRRGSDPHYPKAKRSPALGSSYPTHFRKFDTIMRSGVNVQELRSRFLHHLDSSADVREPTEAAAARTIKQSGPLSRDQKSPRDEALRKLGLLRINASSPNANSPPVIVPGQHSQMPLTEGLNHEATLSGEPVDRQIIVTAQEQVIPP